LRYVTATDKQISVKGSSFKAKRGWKRRSRNHSTITDISIKILNNCSLSFAKLKIIEAKYETDDSISGLIFLFFVLRHYFYWKTWIRERYWRFRSL